jgi:GxxExxY protein
MFNPQDSHGDPRTYAILGGAMEVHSILKRGFLESIYCQALMIEFTARGIPFEVEVPCAVEYKGQRLGGLHHMDFVCYGSVVVEVKARSALGPADQAQVLNYLAISGHTCALLLNFGTPRLDWKRLALGESTDVSG